MFYNPISKVYIDKFIDYKENIENKIFFQVEDENILRCNSKLHVPVHSSCLSCSYHE